MRLENRSGRKTLVVVSVVAIVRESVKSLGRSNSCPAFTNAPKRPASEQDSIVGVHKPFETIAFVIQLLMVKTLGPCQQDVSFRAKPVHRKLAEAANVRAAQKNLFQSEIL